MKYTQKRKYMIQILSEKMKTTKTIEYVMYTK
jgi:hypothetical protein